MAKFVSGDVYEVKMDNMRVCVISSVDMDMPYGSTTRPYYTSINLAEFGCELLHICTTPPKSQEKGIKYLEKNYYKNGLWFVRTYKNIFRMYKECKRFSPDVLYVHQINNATRALPLKYLLRIPLVFDAHGSSVMEICATPNKPFYKYKEKKIKIQEKLILKAADKIIVVSDELKNFFMGYFHTPEEKIELVKNGVDTKSFKPAEPDVELKRELGIYDDDKVVVFTCPRSPINNIALKYLFELIPEIEKSVKNVKFVIIGGGPKINPPSSNVIYTGFVQDFVSYINLGDVCIAPYPPSAVCGGTRNKLADYFACGKPVVSTEEGIRGFDDAVPNRDFLLASDSDDFVNKLISALFDEDLSMKLGENARKLSLKYDWGILAMEVLKVLESTAKSNKRS